MFAVAFRQFRLFGGIAKHEAQRAFHGSVGEFAQGARDIFQPPDAGNVGQRDGERGAALGDAKARHGFGLRFGARRAERLFLRFVNDDVRAFAQQTIEHRMFAQGQACKKGAVAEGCGENGALCFGRHKSFCRERGKGTLGTGGVEGRRR